MHRDDVINKLQKSAKHKSKRGEHVSKSAIISYVGVFVFIVTLIAMTYRPIDETNNTVASANTATANSAISDEKHASLYSVDKLVAANLALSLAESTGMPITNEITTLAQSLAIESSLAQTETNVISKPQIIQPAASSRTPTKYISVTGDTVPILSERFHVSGDTIRWANNIKSDAIEPGKEIIILPYDGILYTVKAGDTLDSIVAKYSGDKNSIIADNDLELSGNPTVGMQIIIRGGILPQNERPDYVNPRSRSYSGGYGSSWTYGMTAGNRYGYGQCTWYAYERRKQLGRPVGGMWGNAYSWSYAAAVNGFAVDGNPMVGDVMQDRSGPYGHVAIVESVVPGVSVSISEMNGYRFGGGWNRVGRGTIPWSEAVSGMYKYIH